jgi:hypothetical protein
MGLNVVKAGTVHVVGDQQCLILHTQRAPDRDGLGGETTVGVARDKRSVRYRRSPYLSEYFEGALKILHTDAAQHGIEGLIRKGQRWSGVEVLHEPSVKARVGSEFLSVHTVAHNIGVGTVIRQMADPTRHQVQQASTCRQLVAIEVGQCGYRAFVNVRNEPGRRLERQVVTFVLLGKGLGGRSSLIIRPACDGCPRS